MRVAAKTGRSQQRRRITVVLCMWVAAVLTLLVPGVRAQEGQDIGSVALGGGQMVRGTVTAVGADKLTVKTEEGDIYQVAVTSNTRLTKARQPVKLAEIKVGDGVGAMGVMDAPAKTVHAVFVAVVDAEEVRKAREGLGKVYITGRVTAIDELKISVKRPDGVVQVIEVDEGTSFQRGGRAMGAMFSGSAGPVSAPDNGAAGAGAESITLADVKVGDAVGGPGALKGGVFVPTVLHVADPAAMRRRRAAEGAPGAAVAPK